MFDCKSGFHQGEEKRNGHIYVTSVMITTFILFLLKQSALSAVIFPLVLSSVCVVSNNVVMYSWFSCDAVTFLKKITFSSEVLVLSDIRSFRNLTFHNVLARQDSSFCNRASLIFEAFALRDIKWRPERAVA